MRESILWAAADQLRPYIDAAEYKEVVLDILCLKSISDKKWTPRKATWGYIVSEWENGNENISSLIQNALGLIESNNKSYSGLFTVKYESIGIPNHILGKILELFQEEIIGNEDDTFGTHYEYFLRNFALSEGKRAGQYYTPRSVVDLLVRLINPSNGILYDPCCGTGGMFVHTIKSLKENSVDISSISFYGQESNSKTWRLAKKNLLGQELAHNLGDAERDTLLNPIHSKLLATYCLANPPFNMSKWGAGGIPENEIETMSYGIPPDSCANYAWLQHIISRLNNEGKAAVILSNGSLDAVDGGQKEIRKKMVESGYVEAIISLPGELFYSTTIPVCIWLINKARKTSKEGVLFVDASSCIGNVIKRGLRELTEENLSDITEIFNHWTTTSRAKNKSNIRSAFVNTEQIIEGPVDLNPGRYTIKSSRELLQGTEWDYTRQEHEVKRSLAEISGTLKILENSLNDSGLNTVGDTTMTLLSSVASAYRVSVNPMKFADEEFDLYSIPSFDDSGKPELAKGSEIGSNKLLIRKPSILISRLNPRTPRIWVARPGVRRAICSTEFTVLEVENNELFSSIFIALHSQVATTYLKSVARGTTGSRKRARESDLMNIRLPLTPSIESPISAAAKELVNLKEQLINGLCLIQEIIPEVADETYRKSTD